MKLFEIAHALKNAQIVGDTSVEITAVHHDSRKSVPGSLFVAMRGEVVDGHNYIGSALKTGASAVMTEHRSLESEGVPEILVPDTRAALGIAAAEVYGRPTEKLSLTGITGTNGKTTLTFLLESIVKAAGGNPGVVGTISHRWGTAEQAAANTTPEASDLQMIFRDMVRDSVTHAFVEVSSHGLHRGRLEACQFDVGVFTNLTQDHLDYHGSLEEYYLAKRILFDRLLPSGTKTKKTAVINREDPYGLRLIRETRGYPIIGYGIGQDSEVRPLDITVDADGIRGTIVSPRGHIQVESALAGSFNLMNILAAVAVCECLEIPIPAVRQGIDAVRAVPGRLERVESEQGTIFVDYAHTPNALKNVLDALRIMKRSRIVTLMGCGGDRDTAKRPLMGVEAAAGSDFVIVTSDNPRSEDPDDIIRQVEVGVRDSGYSPLPADLNGKTLHPGFYKVIPDRGNAIAWAIEHLSQDDILLVAGKGHETYQEIKGVRYPFDDREVIRKELRKHTSGTGPNGERKGSL
jgi:UDP-N-acetylmuramoyl-L-alanyl-D-glutamate--2,6-diaminopimelate ligase